MTIVLARRVGIDLRRNDIVVEWDGDIDVGTAGECPAVVDIGSRGALLGIEIATHWIQIAEAPKGVDSVIRSASVNVRFGPNRVIVPRHGDGYTIAWPSGNQCWRQRVGSRTVETCAKVIDR